MDTLIKITSRKEGTTMRVKIARNKYGFYTVSFYAFNRWIRSGNDAFKTYADAVNWVNANLGSNHTLETY